MTARCSPETPKLSKPPKPSWRLRPLNSTPLFRHPDLFWNAIWTNGTSFVDDEGPRAGIHDLMRESLSHLKQKILTISFDSWVQFLKNRTFLFLFLALACLLSGDDKRTGNHGFKRSAEIGHSSSGPLWLQLLEPSRLLGLLSFPKSGGSGKKAAWNGESAAITRVRAPRLSTFQRERAAAARNRNFTTLLRFTRWPLASVAPSSAIETSPLTDAITSMIPPAISTLSTHTLTEPNRGWGAEKLKV